MAMRKQVRTPGASAIVVTNDPKLGRNKGPRPPVADKAKDLRDNGGQTIRAARPAASAGAL